MKCQKLLITGLVVLSSLTLIISPTFACDHSSQSDGGASSSDNGGSNGNSDSGTSGNQDSSSTSSTTGNDGNAPFYRGSCDDWIIFGNTDWCKDIKGE